MRDSAIAIALACLVIIGLASCESTKTYYAATRGPIEAQSHQPGKLTPRAEAAANISGRSEPRFATKLHHRRASTAAARKDELTKQPASLPAPPTVASVPSLESVEVPVPAAGAPASVTLSAGDNDTAHARDLLDSTRSRLARVDRNNLPSDQIQLYDQVTGFLSAGRRALEANDVNAASGFAGKASQLALKLKESPDRD